MTEETATPQVKRLEVTSEDNWLVQCLILSMFVAVMVSQINGVGVISSLL